MTRRNTLAAAALAAILALPAAAQDAEKTLYFYNWTDYYPVELLAKFEAETGIKVILDGFDSNDTLLDQPASWCRHDGHLDIGGRRCRVPVVVVGVVLRGRGDAWDDDALHAAAFAGERIERDLPGSCLRGHGVHPGRTVLRGEGKGSF